MNLSLPFGAAPREVTRSQGQRYSALVASIVAGMWTCLPAAAAPTMAERYARAAVFGDPQAHQLVLNESVEPHWTGRGAEFWYRRQTATGGDYVLVSSSGVRAAAFDHGAIAAAASEALKRQVKSEALTVEELEPGKRVGLMQEARRLDCSLASNACVVVPSVTQNPIELASPDGRHVIFTRDNNVWIKESGSQTERRLTDDGVEGFGWGNYPDSGLLSVPRQRYGNLPFPPTGFSWSPDGRFVFGARVDERGVPPTYFLEAVPQDGSLRTKAWPVRQPFMGDAPEKTEAVVINVATGKRVALDSSSISIEEPMAWSRDGTRFIAVGYSPDRRTLFLLEASAETGAVRQIHSERPTGFVSLNALMYSAPNVRVIRGGSEVLWYSERSGYGHLYRYRVDDGKLLNAVTTGAWNVRDVLHVDEKKGRIIFTSVGHDAADPYRRRVFHVGFDGRDLRLLTPEAADHQLDGPPQPQVAKLLGRGLTQPVSPDGGVFVDTWSTVDQPPTTALRSTEDGRVLLQLETGDASRLLAAGWRSPIPFVAKSADGKTDLYGALYLPPGADGAAPGSLALVDAVYGGAQIHAVPHNFTEARTGIWAARAAAVAQLGFATFIVDGRGTPLRSRDFHDVAYVPNFADAGIDDQAAVVRQLVAQHPALNAERVGIFGHSFGGYVSARAMLRYPDVFKVGVSSAGIHSATSTYNLASFLPPPVYEDGTSLRPTPKSAPENYRVMDNGRLASNLKGKLLLAFGDLDENAPFSSTAQLIDALIKADRRYDLLYLPNRGHAFPREPYFQRRLWDYLVEHLLLEQPRETSDQSFAERPDCPTR